MIWVLGTSGSLLLKECWGGEGVGCAWEQSICLLHKILTRAGHWLLKSSVSGKLDTWEEAQSTSELQ